MTDGVTTSFLICLIPALVLMLSIYYINRASARHALQPRKTQESRMGQYIGGPRITAHSMVNKLFKPREFVYRFVLAREDFADVSFYQKGINWLVMRSKARKVIIRAGQRNWVDVKFIINYAAAKLAGFLRGVYWFYDGNASPGEQAKILTDLLKLYGEPELGIWIDWERNSGGGHEGLRNVVAMMQEAERLLPGVDVGLYTGYYFFIENSNPITNAGQYAYLKTKKLWLAFYAEFTKVLIPRPWTVPHYWQWGTPAVGREWGVETIEIDMNEDLSGDPEPEPEPESDENGEIMRYKFKVETRERTSPDANGTANLTGKVYQIDEVVDVVAVLPADAAGNTWFKLANGNYAAYIYNGTTRAVLVEAPAPVDSIRVTLETNVTADINGKLYKAHVVVEGVELVAV